MIVTCLECGQTFEFNVWVQWSEGKGLEFTSIVFTCACGERLELTNNKPLRPRKDSSAS